MLEIKTWDAETLYRDARYRETVYCNASVLFADSPTVALLDDLIGVAQKSDPADATRKSDYEFCQYLRRLDDRAGVDLRRRIASEYAELFVGPRPPIAPIFESVYIGSASRLFTEQTISVRRFYVRCGLMVAKEGRVPDDHLSYELELMSFLCRKEAEACLSEDLRSAIRVQTLQFDFLESHLGIWMAPFVERICKSTCGDFYAALARFVQMFVAEDELALNRSIQALERLEDIQNRDKLHAAVSDQKKG